MLTVRIVSDMLLCCGSGGAFNPLDMDVGAAGIAKYGSSQCFGEFSFFTGEQDVGAGALNLVGASKRPLQDSTPFGEGTNCKGAHICSEQGLALATGSIFLSSTQCMDANVGFSHGSTKRGWLKAGVNKDCASPIKLPLSASILNALAG